MYKGIYKLADLRIEIDSLYEEVQRMCTDYQIDGPADFCVTTCETDIEEERKQSEATRKEEGLPPYEFDKPYLETLAVYRKIANECVNRNRLLMHGSVLAVDGKAYMFTAKSGTGKSTHVRLWRRLFGERTVMVNDDKPLVEVTKEGVNIYGTPWDGKHHLSNNMKAPLQAICILTRAKENHIREITPGEAVAMLIQQTYHPEDPMGLMGVLELLNRLMKHVHFYVLGCNMEPEAAVISARGMGIEI